MKTLYTGGTILTMEDRRPYAEALLTEEGRILAVGDARQLDGTDVRQVDLCGGTLMPAFIDPHGHLSSVANGMLEVDLAGCASWADIAGRIRRHIEENQVPEGAWVRASGYDHNALAEKRHPPLALLDDAAGRRPLMVTHQSGHMGLFNSAALEALHVTAATPAPEGGRIGLEAGHLTGYMEENAFLHYQRQAPMPEMAALIGAYRRAERYYRQHGIVTVQDGMVVEQLLPVYRALREAGMPRHIRVAAYAGAADWDAWAAAFPGSVDQWHGGLRLAGMKIFLDGSPQGRTAWMRTPYAGEAEYAGYPAMADEAVTEVMRRCAERGIQLLVHCNGDAAAAQMLRCARQVQAETRRLSATRPVMIHAQLLGLDQMPELKALGIIPSFFPAHIYHWGDIHRQNFGEDRAAHISPAGTALRCGLPFTFHQDTPVLPPDIPETLWCAVCRQTAEGVTLARAEEGVPIWDALKAVTVHAAYAYFEEAEAGVLAPGKRADLVLLDRDPLRTAPERLRDIRVLETFRGQ